MQDGQRPMRKKSYSFVEEPMAKDLEPGSPFKQVSVPSQVSPDRQRLFLNTFSVRDIWNGPDSHSQRLELMMAQSLSSGPEDHLFPFEVMEKNAKVHSLSDFVLAMILSYLGYCADTPAFLECKLKIERALTDRLDQSHCSNAGSALSFLCSSLLLEFSTTSSRPTT